MFKDLKKFQPSDDWFTYEYIDAEVKKKVDKTKGGISGDEMEKETKHCMESLNHDPNWLKTITTEIDKFLMNRKLKCIRNGAKTTVLLHPSKN